MTPVPAAEAESVWHRAQADPQFLVRLRDSYQGRHDVLDALWWAAHPLTDSPSGVADPASRLRELQRAVFSRAENDSPLVEVVDPEAGGVRMVRESELRLRDAQNALEADARHLRDAVEAATRAEPVTAEPPTPDTPVAAPHSRKLLISGGGALGLVAVIVVASQLGNVGADAEPAPTPTASAVPPPTEIVEFGYTGHIGDPYEYLSRTPADDPPFGHWPAGTGRKLPDLVWHADLWLGLHEPESICLAMEANHAGMGACVPREMFATDGLRMRGDGGYAIRPDMEILFEEFYLAPDGAFEYTASARKTLSGEPLLGEAAHNSPDSWLGPPQGDPATYG